MKKVTLIILILLTSIITFGQDDFKEFKTKKMKCSAIMNSKAFPSKNTFKVYADKIVKISDAPKGMKKGMASMNMDPETTYKIKEVKGDKSSITKYSIEWDSLTGEKQKGAYLLINFSEKKPEFTFEGIDPSSGDKIITTFF